VLDRVGGQRHAPAALSPGGRHQVPIVQEDVWAKEPPGVSRRTVEHLASRYTDCYRGPRDRNGTKMTVEMKRLEWSQ